MDLDFSRDLRLRKRAMLGWIKALAIYNGLDLLIESPSLRATGLFV
jgi:hypothetical protein